MKKIPILIAIAFLAISCSLQTSEETGSITLPSLQMRSVTGDASADSYQVRYSLTRNGQTIPINGKAVVEVPQTDTIQIDDLSPGTGYNLAISVGPKSGSIMEVTYYGNSGAFSIAAGTNTKLDLTLTEAPAFTYLTNSGSLSSALVVDGTLYVLDGTDLISFDLPDAKSTTNLGSAFTVNSLSVGKGYQDSKIVDELWLNTDKGIYRRKTGGTVFVSNMNEGLTPNVSLSGAIEFDDVIFGVYSGGLRTVGMVVASNQSEFSTEWYTLEKGMEEYPEIDDYVSDISRDLVSSICVNDTYDFYYVSTPLGTIIGSVELKKIADKKDAFKDDPIGTLKNFWLKIGDGTKSIQQVSTAGNMVFAAPAKGLYTASVNTSGTSIGVPLSTLTIIPGTEGIAFSSLKSYKFSTTVVTAAVTKGNSVLILKDNAVLETLDAAAGIPNEANATFYVDGSGALHLILTGTNGAIDYKPTI